MKNFALLILTTYISFGQIEDSFSPYVQSARQREQLKNVLDKTSVLKRQVLCEIGSKDNIKAFFEEKFKNDDRKAAFWFLKKVNGDSTINFKSTRQSIDFVYKSRPLYQVLLNYNDNGSFNFQNFEIEFLQRIQYFDYQNILIDLYELNIESDEIVCPEELYQLPIDQKIQLKDLIKKYLDKTIAANFFMYDYTDKSKKVVKSILLEHGNDLFFFNNQDRDNTGPFKFEIFTDQLKMRLFNGINSSKILGYQSFFIAGEAFTPYIRYNIDKISEANKDPKAFKADLKLMGYNADALTFQSNQSFFKNHFEPTIKYIQQSIDRPFSSFQYLGRAKYRQDCEGVFRSKGTFKLGFMGKNLGQNIQRLIHEDINPSIRVLNWDSQIAYPGRFVVSTDQRVDFAFKKKNKSILDRKWIYYASAYGKYGTTGTEAFLGGGFSNKSFVNLSGQNQIKHNSKRPFQNLTINSEAKIRYVAYDAMLQGVGFLTPNNNPLLTGSVPNGFVLDSNDVKRFIPNFYLGLNWRLKRMNLGLSFDRSGQSFKRTDWENYLVEKTNSKVMNLSILKNYIIETAEYKKLNQKIEPKYNIDILDAILDTPYITSNFLPKKWIDVVYINFTFMLD